MKIKFKLTLIIIVFLGLVHNTTALSVVPMDPPEVSNLNIKRAFPDSVTIKSLGLSVPTIVEVEFPAVSIVKNGFAVFDEKSQTFVPNITVTKNTPPPKIYSIRNSASNENLDSLFDGNLSTKKDFYLNGTAQNSINLNVNFASPIKTNLFTLSLDRNVSLPDYVTLKALVGMEWVTVLNKVKPSGYAISFPETTATMWIITVDFSQSIRITDISFTSFQSYSEKINVRFLAQPNSNYTIYANPDSSPIWYSVNDTAHLQTNKYKVIGLMNLSHNPLFTEPDADTDGVIDTIDNCIININSDQRDEDGNGVGDVCDDYDNDKIPNYIDNCPNLPNYYQTDTDADKIGDECDPDESRITEKYPIVVWFGLAISSLIFLSLLYVAGMRMRKNVNNQSDNTNLN
jgi:hypothetical protein